MATLPLPPSRRTAAFRAIVRVLQNDPTLKRVVKTWIAWTGDQSDARDFVADDCPIIRLTPSANQPGMEALFVDAESGDFAIDVEIAVAGFDMDDPMNLWGAIENALYPADPAAFNAIVLQLQEVTGGGLGRVKFARPAVSPGADEAGGGLMLAVGMLSIQVLKSI